MLAQHRDAWHDLAADKPDDEPRRRRRPRRRPSARRLPVRPPRPRATSGRGRAHSAHSEPFDHENKADGNDKIVHEATALKRYWAGGGCSAGASPTEADACGSGAAAGGVAASGAGLAPAGAVGCSPRLRAWRRVTHCVVEILEELGIGTEQQPGIARLQRRLVGLHRAVEGEEVRILAEGLGDRCGSARRRRRRECAPILRWRRP